MALDAATLLLHIEESFGGMPYPGDEHIVADNSGLDPERDRVKTALMGHHCRDVPFETLDQLRSALPILSAEGYRFYLPSFMVISIEDFVRADVIPDEVISSLTLPYVSDVNQIRSNVDRTRELEKDHPAVQRLATEEWEQVLRGIDENYRSGWKERLFFERVSGFDKAQCKVIREFLEYMQDARAEEFWDRVPEIAIERYWYQFAEGNAERGEGDGS